VGTTGLRSSVPQAPSERIAIQQGRVIAINDRGTSACVFPLLAARLTTKDGSTLELDGGGGVVAAASVKGLGEPYTSTVEAITHLYSPAQVVLETPDMMVWRSRGQYHDSYVLLQRDTFSLDEVPASLYFPVETSPDFVQPDSLSPSLYAVVCLPGEDGGELGLIVRHFDGPSSIESARANAGQSTPDFTFQRISQGWNLKPGPDFLAQDPFDGSPPPQMVALGETFRIFGTQFRCGLSSTQVEIWLREWRRVRTTLTDYIMTSMPRILHAGDWVRGVVK
jgi:hypothetical protein